MAQESFYGGRQGAPFIIVRFFDGEDIPQSGEYVYQKKTCAIEKVNNSVYFRYPWIEKTSGNYKDYSWGVLDLDGGSKNVILDDGTLTTQNADTAYAEGMRQCFEQGGATTSGKGSVNYGEYVIIDTISRMCDYSNPENGRVYRRGMNYDYSPTNPLAGAEYIGQIVGPQGNPADMGMDTVQHILDAGGTSKSYTPAAGGSQSGIVPGRYWDEDNQEYKFNDNITYAWQTYISEDGVEANALFGFTFPYSVEEFNGVRRSPYYQAGDDIPEGKAEGDLLPADFELIERVDDGSHPYFKQWKINVPKGIKGNSIEGLEIYPTFVRAGAKIYEASSLEGNYTVAVGTERVDVDNYDPSLDYIKVDGGYVATVDVWKTRVRYKEYNYNESQAGEYSFVDIGEYNAIEKVSLAPDGTLTAYYSYGESQVINTTDDTKLKWVKFDSESAEDAQGLYVEDDGTLVIVYNTLKNGVNEVQRHEEAIPWVQAISLSAEGAFKIVYNNNSDRITNATGSETDGQGITRKIYETTLRTITNVRINTKGNGSREGDGSQQLEVKYSNETNYFAIGEPLNYIIDTLVVPGDDERISLRNHLLVYYSDPNRRNASSIASQLFYSKKIGSTVGGWTDLGNVQGERGNINIIGKFTDIIDLGNDSPEVIKGSATTPDYRYAGWCALVGDDSIPDVDYHLAVYDYVVGEWIDAGVYIKSVMDPRQFITVDDTYTELKENGFLIDVNTVRRSAERT